MTGLVRKATLLAVLGLLAASAALAGVPASFTAESQSGAPGNVMRIGPFRSNQPDPGALNGAQISTVTDARAITIVTIFDAGNNRVPNSTVTLNFSACTGLDLDLCSSQPFHTINCGASTVTDVTDANGEIVFRVAGNFSAGPPIDATTPAPGAGLNCATITADTQALGSITAAGPDLNGTAGVNAADLSILTADLFRQVPAANVRGRSNLNGSGEAAPVNAADLSILLQYLFDTVIPPGANAGVSSTCTDC